MRQAIAAWLAGSQALLLHGQVPPLVLKEEHFYSFEQFEKDFSRNYASTEREARRRIVQDNIAFVRSHNSNPQRTWDAAVNELADRSLSEIHTDFTGLSAGMRLGGRRSSALLTHKNSTKHVITTNVPSPTLPDSVDWRRHGAVSDVQRQGACGSCWAFAAAGALESHLAIASGQMHRVSAGVLRDCVPNPKACGGEGGCQGAIPQLAYNFTHERGIILESDYSYSSNQGLCNIPGLPQKRATIQGYVQLPANDPVALMQALASAGPVSVSVAVPRSFASYSSGVLTCGEANEIEHWKIAHAVLAVGYGVDPDHGKYWIIKNSWGERWGEAGYIRIARSDSATEPCGTDVAPELGFSCKPYPSKITVCGHCGILSDSSYPVGVVLA
mmetsp:Transcript_18248/g.40346  ORF Transcript_18248/g.40346 Transcript_18248/m.40346 type:complete len:386 (-) Transcript_18248:163-1320(-)